MNAEQQIAPWGQIVAKAWQDDSFKRRLLSNPALVLTEYGLELPAHVQVRVVENTDRLVHLTIPASPRGGELRDDDLEKVAGGRLGYAVIDALAKVFGWNDDQFKQVYAADMKVPQSGAGQGNDRSPPGPA